MGLGIMEGKGSAQPRKRVQLKKRAQPPREACSTQPAKHAQAASCKVSCAQPVRETCSAQPASEACCA